MNGDEMIKEIYSRVKENNAILNDLTNWRSGLEVACGQRDRQISRIESVVFGNPDPEKGLMSQVQRLIDCKSSMSYWKQFWLGVFSRVIVWGIIGIIAYGLYLYKTHGGG